MKIVGNRKPVEISFDAKPENLKMIEFNDSLFRFVNYRGFIPKGVYHFKTHEEANEHYNDCLTTFVAKLYKERMAK